MTKAPRPIIPLQYEANGDIRIFRRLRCLKSTPNDFTFAGHSYLVAELLPGEKDIILVRLYNVPGYIVMNEHYEPCADCGGDEMWSQDDINQVRSTLLNPQPFTFIHEPCDN